MVDTMGVIPREKALSTSQLKNVSKVWYEQWRGEIPLGVGFVDLEEFKEAFLHRFFPLELREKKMVEFMNLC